MKKVDDPPRWNNFAWPNGGFRSVSLSESARRPRAPLLLARHALAHAQTRTQRLRTRVQPVRPQLRTPGRDDARRFLCRPGACPRWNFCGVWLAALSAAFALSCSPCYHSHSRAAFLTSSETSVVSFALSLATRSSLLPASDPDLVTRAHSLVWTSPLASTPSCEYRAASNRRADLDNGLT